MADTLKDTLDKLDFLTEVTNQLEKDEPIHQVMLYHRISIKMAARFTHEEVRALVGVVINELNLKIRKGDL